MDLSVVVFPRSAVSEDSSEQRAGHRNHPGISAG